jgi:AcrR family transcriptional regulator
MTSQAVQRLTRTEARAQTRQRIVDAAMRVFAMEGYAGASVNAIAEQAGYTIGALYSNFGTKDEVFLAAFEQHCGAELASLEELIASTHGVEELMGAITERFTDLGEQHRQWWALWAELWLYGQRHPEAAHRLAEVQAQTRASIARAFREAEQPASDELIAIVHALWTGFMLYRLTEPEALDAGAFHRAVHWLLAGAATTSGGSR